MATIQQEADRKYELLERYRTARLDEILEEAREQLPAMMDEEQFPWKGEFRSREEIELLYTERKRWDKRFLLDVSLLAVFFFFLTIVAVKMSGMLFPSGSNLMN